MAPLITETTDTRFHVCPECLGRTQAFWRDKGMTPEGKMKKEQYVRVVHKPGCNTGINAYNSVHRSHRKGQNYQCLIPPMPQNTNS